MPGRIIAALALVAAIAANQATARAHAGLRLSDPLEGATLGDTPMAIRLTFSERPDPALSDIRVADSAGAVYHLGRPAAVPGDPLSLSVKVRPLDRGVFTVRWRIVSAVDGHPTSGMYAFGVRTSPAGAPGSASTADPPVSLLEILARSMFITGLVALLGGAAASVARFGGGTELSFGVFGWLLAGVGVALLAMAQARNAAVPLGDLLSASVGRSLVWRSAAVAAAGAALAIARWLGPQGRRAAMAGVLLASLAAVAAHVAGGHAAASDSRVLATVASQWAHFALVGVWLGGLAPLLAGLRGAPSSSKADAVGRFSFMAAISLLVVVVTGAVRTAGELSAWSDLTSTRYGQAVLVKIVLAAGIAAFAGVNRWRGVPAAATDLRLLRRAGSGELALAAAALVVAAVLATLPPPAAALRSPSGLEASGADFGTTLRVRLAMPSDQPGPNRFVLRVVDYDSQRPVTASRVSLRFAPLDDPGVAPTSLDLAAGPDDAFVGAGANLAFDGRWQITALIERAGDSVEVPMEVETRAPPQFVSIARPLGQAPGYMVQVEGTGHVWISPDPERAGRSRLTVTCFDVLRDERAVQEIVVTVSSGNGPTRQQQVKRVSPSSFVTEVDFQTGANRIVVVARGTDGTRLRAVLNLDIPR